MLHALHLEISWILTRDIFVISTDIIARIFANIFRHCCKKGIILITLKINYNVILSCKLEYHKIWSYMGDTNTRICKCYFILFCLMSNFANITTYFRNVLTIIPISN